MRIFRRRAPEPEWFMITYYDHDMKIIESRPAWAGTTPEPQPPAGTEFMSSIPIPLMLGNLRQLPDGAWAGEAGGADDDRAAVVDAYGRELHIIGVRRHCPRVELVVDMEVPGR